MNLFRANVELILFNAHLRKYENDLLIKIGSMCRHCVLYGDSQAGIPVGRSRRGREYALPRLRRGDPVHEGVRTPCSAFKIGEVCHCRHPLASSISSQRSLFRQARAVLVVDASIDVHVVLMQNLRDLDTILSILLAAWPTYCPSVRLIFYCRQ